MPGHRSADEAGAGPAAEPVVLDGRGLTCADVADVARRGRPVALAPAGRARNADAFAAMGAIVARGGTVYGLTTGVGPLRGLPVDHASGGEGSERLLRSHAGGGGGEMAPELVRAAMVARANQVAAGGAGLSSGLLDALVAALNAGFTPVARELGSLGTGDLSVLAEIGLALLGEGEAVLPGLGRLPAGEALARASLTVPALHLRDGLGFVSSGAASIGHAALVAVDARGLHDAALAVGALSFDAGEADPTVLDARVQAARPHPGQVAVAGRMRRLLGEDEDVADHPRSRPAVHDAYPYRCFPQVEGAMRTVVDALEAVLTVELNAASENALLIAADEVALPNGNFHGGVVALALDALRPALAQSATLAAGRVSLLLDAGFTGLPSMLAADPGPDSGAMILEYTAHTAAGEVRWLAAPVSAQAISVGAGVESHGSLATLGAHVAHRAVDRAKEIVAVELVLAVRALRMRGRAPRAPATRRILSVAAAELPSGLEDRPLHADLESARRVLAVL